MSIDPLRRLLELGHDLTYIPYSQIPNNLSKSCLICINTNISYQRKFGFQPINDAANFAEIMKKIGYKIFILHNPHARSILNYFKILLINTNNQFIFFYNGQMNQKYNYDNKLIFDDEELNYENFFEIFQYKNQNCNLYLISDITSKDSLFNISNFKNFPNNILTFSTLIIDNLNINENNNFISKLIEILKENKYITPLQILNKLKKNLKKYNLNLILNSNNEILLNNSF